MESKSPKGKKPRMTLEENLSNDITFPQRVQSSASGLAREVVFGARASDASSVLTETLVAESKAESSAASSVQSDTSLGREAFGSSSEDLFDTSSQTYWDRLFRSPPTPREALGFDTQFEMGEAALRDDDASSHRALSEPGRAPTAATVADGVESIQPRFDAVWDSSKAHSEKDFRRLLDVNDGSAVVELLSDSSFQPAFSFESARDDDQLYTILAEEIGVAHEFNMLLATSMSLGEQCTDGAFETAVSQLPNQRNANDNQPFRNGQPVPFARMKTFFDEIENYHEDVWGFLRPYVAAARLEIVERRGRDDGDISDGPAVRRLGMMLGHLRGSQISPATDALSARLKGREDLRSKLGVT